jgi:hypothetical protein
MLLPMSLIHAMKQNDVARRDALLDQLRLLAEAHPEDNWVGQSRSNGLLDRSPR